MATPKSTALLQKEAEAAGRKASTPPVDSSPLPKVYRDDESIPVKEVKCYNDFVAILQFRVESRIILGETDNLKNEGVVIGVGPGIPGPNGVRVGSQLKLGDVVVFYGNPTTSFNAASGVYKGQRVIIVPERAILCGLAPRPFHVVTGEEA